MYWTIKTANAGDYVIFLDTPTSYKNGTVRKIKGSAPAGEAGNVQIELDDGSHVWVKGSMIMPSLEAAEKQINYNRKTER